MRLDCPCCGPRMGEEFTYLGDARMMDRPADGATFDHVFLRDNPAGRLRELWFHEAGCRAWLVVERDTVSHEIFGVTLASQAKAGERHAG